MKKWGLQPRECWKPQEAENAQPTTNKEPIIIRAKKIIGGYPFPLHQSTNVGKEI